MHIFKNVIVIALGPQDIRESRKHINYLELKFEDFHADPHELHLADMVTYRNGQEFRLMKSRY